MSVDSALRELDKSSHADNRSGLWVGRVEDVDDPERISRVRVRVFMIHGDTRQTATENLPWAELSDFGGGGPDYGSGGLLYPVGSTVWVMFEMGDDNFPVVMGGRRGSKVERDDTNPVEFLTVAGKDDSTTERPWFPDEENELPKDVFDAATDGDRHPTRTVWNKSFKGHTIVVEDRDGHEFLQIIDRVGQVIEMSCPVTTAANENNAAQRGTRNATLGTQLPQGDIDKRAYIRLIDVAGQEILMDGASSNEKIQLTSRSREGASIQKLVLSSGKGKEKIEMTDKQGNTFLLDPNSPTPILLLDYAGNKIEFDAENGVLCFNPANQLEEITGGKKTMQVGGTYTRSIVGDESTKVLGNKFLDVLNDLTTTVAGLTSAILTGPVDIKIVNAQMDPTAINPTALGVTVVAGGIEFETLAGNIKYRTLVGTSNLGSVSGVTTLHGSTVALGSNPAQFPLAIGPYVQAILNQIVVGLQSDIRIGNLGAPVPPSPTLIAALTAVISLIQTMNSTTVTVQP